MRKWKFQVKNSPKEISEKLESSITGRNRFALSMDYDKTDLVKFRLRKRVLLAFELIGENNIIVNGKMFKVDNNETEVEVSFTPHPVSKLLLYVHIFLGLGLLAGIIFEINTSFYMFIVAGVFLAIAFLFKLHLQKLFNKHVEEYKILLSRVLNIPEEKTRVKTI